MWKFGPMRFHYGWSLCYKVMKSKKSCWSDCSRLTFDLHEHEFFVRSCAVIGHLLGDAHTAQTHAAVVFFTGQTSQSCIRQTGAFTHCNTNHRHIIHLQTPSARCLSLVYSLFSCLILLLSSWPTFSLCSVYSWRMSSRAARIFKGFFEAWTLREGRTANLCCTIADVNLGSTKRVQRSWNHPAGSWLMKLFVLWCVISKTNQTHLSGCLLLCAFWDYASNM